MRTHPTVLIPSSQTESAALSAPTLMVLHLDPPQHFCGSLSFVAPPCASNLISDHPWLSGHKWTRGPKPACLPEDFHSTESLWIYLLSSAFSIYILLKMDYTHFLVKSGSEYVTHIMSPKTAFLKTYFPPFIQQKQFSS